MTHVLYGDGVHDDTPAIQEMLDSGIGCVYLPPPKAFYQISRTLKMYSFQELKLDRWTVIKLVPKSNCPMLTNADHANGNQNIAITGGIWDFNNLEQAPNPQMVVDATEVPPPMREDEVDTNHPFGVEFKRMAIPADYPAEPTIGKPMSWNAVHKLSYRFDRYFGIGIRLINVGGFKMTSLTLRNPVTYAFQAGALRNFTISHIVFDFNEGNPSPDNMDGLHFDGLCSNGYIADLKGTCYDDLLAFNAYGYPCESPCIGPIENIVVDGIFADYCHSAVRLLSCGQKVRNINIRNVHGTFYRYTVGLTHFHSQCKATGQFDNIVLENFSVAKAIPLPSDWNRCADWGVVWLEGVTNVKTLKITGFHRIEENTPTPCVELEPTVRINSLILDDIFVENHLPQEVELLHNDGVIQNLRLGLINIADNVREIGGKGTIGQKKQF